MLKFCPACLLIVLLILFGCSVVNLALLSQLRPRTAKSSRIFQVLSARMVPLPGSGRVWNLVVIVSTITTDVINSDVIDSKNIHDFLP